MYAIVQCLQYVFRDHAILQVNDWVAYFKGSHALLSDDPWQGHLATAITPNYIQIVQKCMIEECWVTLSEITNVYGIRTSSIVEILHDHLPMNKV